MNGSYYYFPTRPGSLDLEVMELMSPTHHPWDRARGLGQSASPSWGTWVRVPGPPSTAEGIIPLKVKVLPAGWMSLPPGCCAAPSPPSAQHTLESALRNPDPECIAQGGCLGLEPRFSEYLTPLMPKKALESSEAESQDPGRKS
jgi:hypothetical protein